MTDAWPGTPIEAKVDAGVQWPGTPLAAAQVSPENMSPEARMQFEKQQGDSSSNPAVSYLNTAARSVARGVPFANDFAALGNTAVSYVLPEGSQKWAREHGIDLGETPEPGAGFGERFSANKRAQNIIGSVEDQERPVTSLAGQVGGAMALPLGAASKAATLGGKVLSGAAIGGGLGGLYGFGNGDDLSDRTAKAIEGGVVGGVAGGAIPAVLSVAAKPLSAIAGHMFPQSIAEGRVADAVRQGAATSGDRLTHADIAASEAAGQPIVVGDLGGERVKALARSARNTSTEAADLLQNATKDRFASQSPRAKDFIQNEVFNGGELNGTAITDRLKEAAKAANKTAYDAAHASPNAQSMWTPELQRLTQSPAVQRAIGDVERAAKDEAVVGGSQPIRNPFKASENGGVQLSPANAAGESATPNLAFWDMVQRNLRDQIDTSQRAGANTEAARLGKIRTALTGELDKQVPEFAAARSGAAKAFGAEDALEAGQKFATQNKGIAITDAQKAIGSMSDPERELFARGYAGELMQKLTNRSKSNVVDTVFSGNGRQKIEMALGPDRTNQIEAYMRREKIMNDLHTAVNGNSSTAKQLIEAGLAGLGTGAFEAYHNGSMDPADIAKAVAFGALGAGAHYGAHKANENVIRQVGEILSSNDPKVISAILQKSENPSAIMDAIKAVGHSITGAGASKVAASQAATKATQESLPSFSEYARGGLVKGNSHGRRLDNSNASSPSVSHQEGVYIPKHFPPIPAPDRSNVRLDSD